MSGPGAITSLAHPLYRALGIRGIRGILVLVLISLISLISFTEIKII